MRAFEELNFFDCSANRSGQARKAMIEKAGAVDLSGSDFDQFGYDYFDNAEVGIGYGGYHYDGRYSDSVAEIIAHYGLHSGDSVLELGCAKGCVLVEFYKQGMGVCGIDISEYAVSHSVEAVRPFLQVGSSEALAVADNSFDFVYSKEMIPHLSEQQVRKTLREMSRVCNGNRIFLEIQVAESKESQDLIMRWDPTHQTVKSKSWWRSLLAEEEFEGQVHFKELFATESV